jgi:ABC-type uncharacterized transport system YnjBCD ATPase subunit
MGEILLEVKNFSVVLDGSPILSALNFSVEEGEFLTILGPKDIVTLCFTLLNL